MSRIGITDKAGRFASGLHIAFFLLVVAVPIYAIFMALRSVTDGGGPAESSGLIDGSRWLVLLGNTATVCAAALLTALLLGITLGFLVARTDLPGRRLIILAVAGGACLPLYVSVVFIFALIPLWQFAHSAVACGVLHGLICAPLAVLVMAAVFRCGARELEDQARLDATDAQVVRSVTLPQAVWGMVTVGILVIWLVATDHSLADILIVRTFAEEVYTQFMLNRGVAGPLLTGLPLLIVLGLILIGLQHRYHLLGESMPWNLETAPRVIILKRSRRPLAVICFVIIIGLLGPAFCALIGRIVPLEELTGGLHEARLMPVAGEYLRKLFLTVGNVLPDVLRGGICSVLGAAIMVVFSVGLAWTALRTRRLRLFIQGGVLLLLSLPAAVVGISLIGLFNREMTGGLCDSPAIIVYGYVVRFLPLAILLLLPAIQRVPRDNEDAARLDGCGWLRVQRHVYWPAVSRHVVVVWLVILVLCFGEVGASVLLAPPGWSVAAVRAATLIHFGVYRDLAVLSLLSVAFILIPWLVLILLIGHTLDGTRRLRP